MMRRMMMVVYIMMTIDDTGARYDDRAMYFLSDMSHVLDRITDRKVGSIDALSKKNNDDVSYIMMSRMMMVIYTMMMILMTMNR